MESKFVYAKYLEFRRLRNRKLKGFYGKENIFIENKKGAEAP
jgi:hypothetical protein